MSFRRLAALVCLAVVGARPAVALAEAGDAPPEARAPTARVLVPACADFDGTALIAMLRVELQTERVELAGSEGSHAPGPDDMVVAIDAPSCSATSLAVSIERAAGGAPTRQTVELGDTRASDRSRVLALAIAELIRDARAAPRPASTPAEDDVERERVSVNEAPAIDEAALERLVEARVAAALASRRRAPAPWRPRVVLAGRLELAFFPTFGGTFAGLQAGADLRLARATPLRLVIEGGYRFGGGPDVLGWVGTHHVMVSLGLQLAFGRPSVAVLTGPRVEAGWAFATGHGAAPEITTASVDGAVLTASWQVDLLFRLTRALSLLIDAQLGATIVGLEVRAAERYVGGVGGPLVAVGLGLAGELPRRDREGAAE